MPARHHHRTPCCSFNSDLRHFPFWNDYGTLWSCVHRDQFAARVNCLLLLGVLTFDSSESACQLRGIYIANRAVHGSLTPHSQNFYNTFSSALTSGSWAASSIIFPSHFVFAQLSCAGLAIRIRRRRAAYSDELR